MLRVILRNLHVWGRSVKEHCLSTEGVLTNRTLLVLVDSFVNHFHELPLSVCLFEEDGSLIVSTSDVRIFANEPTCEDGLTLIV